MFTYLLLALAGTVLAWSPSHRKGLSTLRMSSEDLLFQTASRIKIVPWGIGSNDVRVSVEVQKPMFRLTQATVELSRVGGIGLDLVEMSTVERAVGFGLVLVGGLAPGSNAVSPISGSFAMGDVLKSVEGVVENGQDSQKTSLEGLDLEATLQVLGGLGEFSTVRFTVMRLSERKIVNVKVCGPDGAPYTELKVLSGLGANMRTLLQASNVNMYAPATSRFDSPYQKGNCAGEGTCGTCMVAVTSGASLLNPRMRVEDKALRQQAFPPNFRWACRALIGEDEESEGDLTIRLRPQTLI